MRLFVHCQYIYTLFILLFKHYYVEVKTREVKTQRGLIPASYSPIEVVAVREHSFRDDVDQAEIRQTITKHYPGARPYSSNIDPLFNISDFDFDATDHDNVRVCWLNVPKGKTKQDVEKQLASYPEATIYRILADEVELVLSEEQLHAIKDPEFDYTLPQAKMGHVVIGIDEESGEFMAVSSAGEFMNDAVETDENGKCTKILKEKKLQFISKGFSLEWCDDTDLREKVTRVSVEQSAESASKQPVGDPATTKV